jgi:hypothetical protein
MPKRKTLRLWQQEQTTRCRHHPAIASRWITRCIFLLDLEDELDLSEILVPFGPRIRPAPPNAKAGISALQMGAAIDSPLWALIHSPWISLKTLIAFL